MKISRTWIQSYVDLSGISDAEISRAVTLLGFEVENITSTGAPKLDLVVVGEILTRTKVPNPKKEISLCTVDVGPAGGVKSIVCGAPNCDPGRRVPVALPGAVLPGDFRISQSKKYGHESQGMLCGPDEIGLPPGNGLLILDGSPALGTPINDVLPAGDVVFDVEITPNRPDCQSHLGLARELAAWFKKPFTPPATTFVPQTVATPARPDVFAGARVEATDDCALYTATVITGVKVGPSPDWLQRHLTAVGLRPINNVVDIGNFVLLETGQPVHAFDAAKLSGAQIVVRHSVDGEKITTLDGKDRALTPGTLVIADAAKPVVIAGIMGGADSGVTPATTDLVLEVAHFRRQTIRAATKRLGLSSDSAYRYERGVDIYSLGKGLRRCVDLILEIAGGQVAGPTHKVGSLTPWHREITLTPRYVYQKLGFEIPEAEMLASLQALQLNVSRETEPYVGESYRNPDWTVSVPTWRDDLERPIDLVEEILRLYGTEKIPVSTVLAPGLVGDDDPIVLFNRTVTAALVGQSFNECVNYTLRAAKEIAAWAPESTTAQLALANPFVEDQSHLRPTLISGLLESLKLNQSRGVAASRLFETGRIFLERNGTPVECIAVAFIINESETDRTWLKRAPADFYVAKRLLGTIAGAAGIDLARQPFAPIGAPGHGWQEGHAATAGEIAHGWTARCGLIDLAHLKTLGVAGKIYAGIFAILPEKLTAAAAGSHRRYQPFGLVPAALRDLALVVDAALPAAEVQKALAKVARAAVGTAFALESVDIFDVYQGKGLAEGTKSLAFSLVFRAPDRTLTDDEVNVVFTKIQADLLATTPYQIRK